jgi:Zn-dependent protease
MLCDTARSRNSIVRNRGCRVARNSFRVRESPSGKDLAARARVVFHPRMLPTQQGAMRLFRVVGIDVFLHYSWFVVAVIELQTRTKSYGSPIWNVLEYLSIFFIVLLHEFGHALACRQVGGRADRIVLWPLGGVAYVAPPQRAGPVLWSIAAGPLVNVALVPTFLFIAMLARGAGIRESMPDAYEFLRTVAKINFGLLIFNVLPIYPLDGGQILRALLWFPLGRARSLMVATAIGFVGLAGVVALLVYAGWGGHFDGLLWPAVLSFFLISNCVRGWKQARALAQLQKLTRRDGFACPSCHSPPPIGALWRCGGCGMAFDTFQENAVCPSCHAQYAVTRCLDCGEFRPIAEWRRQVGS